MIHPFAALDYYLVKEMTTFVAAAPARQVVVYIVAEVLILFYPLAVYLLWSQSVKGRKTRSGKKAVILVLVCVVLAVGCKTIIDFLWARPRPFVTHPDIMFMSLNSVDRYSFPSGHTLLAATVGGSLWKSGYRRLGGILSIGALLIGVARISAGVHYPTDVLGSIGIAWLTVWYLHRDTSTLKAYLPDV